VPALARISSSSVIELWTGRRPYRSHRPCHGFGIRDPGFHWASCANRYPDQLPGGITPHRTQKLYYATATLLCLTDSQFCSLFPRPPSILGTSWKPRWQPSRRTPARRLSGRVFKRTYARGAAGMFHLAARVSSQVDRKRICLRALAKLKRSQRGLIISLSMSGFESSRTRCGYFSPP